MLLQLSAPAVLLISLVLNCPHSQLYASIVVPFPAMCWPCGCPQLPPTPTSSTTSDLYFARKSITASFEHCFFAAHALLCFLLVYHHRLSMIDDRLSYSVTVLVPTYNRQDSRLLGKHVPLVCQQICLCIAVHVGVLVLVAFSTSLSDNTRDHVPRTSSCYVFRCLTVTSSTCVCKQLPVQHAMLPALLTG